MRAALRARRSAADASGTARRGGCARPRPAATSSSGPGARPRPEVRQFAEQAQEQQSAALAEEFPYLAEVVAGHVAVGYDFAAAFEYGLDLILEALERRRDAAA